VEVAAVNLTPSGSAPAADYVPRGRERSPRLVRIGRRRWPKQGTAEQWIKEGKAATHWTRLSCHRFRANEVRLTSFQQRLFKTGGRLIRHARSFILQLAESYLTVNLFRQMLQRIEQLAWHPTG